MRAIRRFTIHPALPEPLEPLRSLMLNLRWSWHAPTRQLFAAIDPDSQELAEQDPVALLGQLPQGRLTTLAADQHFLRWLAEASDDLTAYLTGPRWYQGEPASGVDARPSARSFRTFRRNTASRRPCRSTPAALASWLATISRPPATSACR